jgi:hypothetical protein
MYFMKRHRMSIIDPLMAEGGSPYVVSIIVCFAEFIGDGVGFTVLKVCRAFGQNALGSSLQISTQAAIVVSLFQL